MRKIYIDNLRTFTVLLLIPYHAAMAWNVWGEPNYIFFEGNKILSSIIVLLSPYFMPILFLLAGISTNYALCKRNIKQYISERARKLLIPFVLGTFLLMPPMAYIADVFNCGYSGNFFEHYRVFFTRFTDLTGADGGFSVGQFWFILYLFVISVISVIIISVLRKIKPEFKPDLPFWTLGLLGLPLPLLSEVFSIGGKSLAEYTYIFLLGYYIFSNENSVKKAEKYRYFSLILGLFSAVLNVYLFIWSDVKYPLLNTAAKFFAEWFMLLGILGIGKHSMDFSGKVTQYLSKKSFLFYIWHFVWVVLFQYLLFGFVGNVTFILYGMSVILSYITTLLCCEIWIKIKCKL